MRNVIKRYGEKIVVLGILTLTIAIVCFPLRNKELAGNCFPDLGYHLMRIEAIKESILAKQFPIRIGSMMLNGWGYGSPLFYPDFFLYLAAIFRICGVNIEWSYKLLVIVITILINCSTYFSYRLIIKNKYSAALATSLLMLSQYYMADIHNRSGISEYIAFIFVPILIAGLYDLYAGDGKHIYLIGCGLFGLICSHSITFAMGVIFVVISVLCNVKRIWKNRILFKRLFITGIITILASTFVYVPLLEQLLSTDLHFHHPWARIEDMAEPISSWFLLEGYYSTIAYIGIGIPIFVGIAVRFCKGKWENKWIDRVIITGVVLILITCKYFPWSLIGKTFLKFIQFPYRLYTLAFPLISLGIGMIFAELFTSRSKRYLKCVIYLCICALTFYFGLKQARFIDYAEETSDLNESFFGQKDNTFYIGAEEWLPSGIKGKHLIARERNVRNQAGENLVYNEGYNEIVFNVDAKNEIYEIPFIYYKGYSAILKMEDGYTKKLPVTTEGNSGSTFVTNSTGFGGMVRIYYKGTLLQKISLYISGITLFFLLFIIIIKRDKFLLN